MAPRDKYYTGSTVSRHLSAEDRSWDEVVGQSGKPILDSELNLQQEIGREISRRLYSETVPSGWLRGPGAFDPFADFAFPGSADLNSFFMNRRTALVAGMPVVVEYTSTATPNRNIIELEAATTFDGGSSSFKRSDFVFLEVWRALVAPDAKSTGTIQLADFASVGGTAITVNGTTLTEGVDYAAGVSAEATIAVLQPLVNAIGGVTADIDPSSQDTLIIRAVLSGTPGNGIVISTADPAVWTVTGMSTIASDNANKPTPDTLYRHGNVDADAAVNLPDDTADPVIKTETTQRVQIQYRIRTTGASEGVNFATEADGFSNANVLAQGSDANASPVATYPFVPADNSSTSANSDATAYGQVDDGLWIAGDGSSTAAAALGTVDGFVYAIPIAFVHRRNDAWDSPTYTGFDPAQNANGALSYNHGGVTNTHINKVIPATESDRPDGLFHDVIVPTDVQDLRRHVFPGGTDLSAELRRQMQLVLDGTLATWAIDGSDKQTIGDGTGDISTQFLVCNEIGRSSGGGTVSGDTTRGVTIGDFDHVRRRFSDQPVVERVVFTFDPSVFVGADAGKHVDPAAGGGTGRWYEGDVLVLDLSNLDISTIGDWDPSTTSWAGGQFTSVVPAGTQITNVLSMYHDDGNAGGAVDQTVKAKLIEGLGSDLLEITLDANHTEVTWSNASPPLVIAAHEVVGDSGVGDVGSQRRIFVEVEITYPIAAGTTDTPDAELSPDSPYEYGPLIENDSSQRSADFEDLVAPRFREGKREIALEYIANDSSAGVAVSDYVISRDDETLVLPRRIYGSGSFAVTLTDWGGGVGSARDVDLTTTEYGSSTRVVKPDTGTTGPFTGDQVPVLAEYFPQDPLPNSGGTGYQVSVYYRTNAPQTAGSKAGTPSIPSTVNVEPLVMARDLWTGTVGSGSTDISYPYSVPMDQIAINADADVGGVNPGEWYYAAQAKVSVDDFDAETGLLNLHAMVPTDGASQFTFELPDKDSEFRAHYKRTDLTAYRPTVFGQPFSGAVRHKVWMPFLVRMTSDETTNGLWRKNEVMLAVISRFAEFDDENTIRFTDAADEAAVALYRTRGLILLAGE